MANIEKILKSLNEKQRQFCQQYIIDWNATRAYQEVYKVSYNAARAHGSRLVANGNIKKYIEEIKDKIEELAGISKLKVINEHMKLAFSSIAHLHNTWITRKEFEDLTAEQKACIAEISTSIKKRKIGKDEYEEIEYVKIKLYDKQKSLESISKIMGYEAPVKSTVNLVEEKMAIIHLPGNPVSNP